MPDTFDLMDFLPYLLNQAAEKTSLEFQALYRGKYGMLRTEWRVLFHVGCYGEMTAKEICDRARIHKTKVSRAVAALEDKRFLTRHEVESDRRSATLALTRQGAKAFEDLSEAARSFDAEIRATMSEDEARVLHRCLIRISKLDTSRPGQVTMSAKGTKRTFNR